MPNAALITGAGKRLGRAMALAMADRGFDVAVHYNTAASEAEEVADEIRAKGRNAVAIGADLLDEAQVTPLVGQASAALGTPLTLLVNNASIFEPDDFTNATRDSWDRAIETNLRAPFVLTQVFAQQAPKAKLDADGEPEAQALVVNMIDQRVRKLTPDFMSYTIAKMGLWAMTRTAAQGLAPDVRINGIGPGPTVIGVRQRPEHFAKQRASSILGRGATPDDIIAALNYLIDARSVTGQLICVDGGQHLVWQTADVMGLE